MNKERLQKVVDYLRSNELRKFNFGCINNCVLSLLPKIFPGENITNPPIFFGISLHCYMYLFHPYYETPIAGRISSKSTKDEVANHWQAFIASKPEWS